MSKIHAIVKRYLSAQYRDGARGEDGFFDCWGLARAARVELYGRQMLPSRGGEYQRDPAGFTRHFREQSSEMVEVSDPAPGAVIAVLKRRVVCVHVALVVHDVYQTGLGLHALDINPGKSVRLLPLYRFADEFRLRILKFYDDKNLP